MRYDYLNSPLGLIQISENFGKICALDFVLNKTFTSSKSEALLKCKFELGLYFERKLQEFSVEIEIGGTQFEQNVYKALLQIPYSTTKTYAQIAACIDHPRAYRAVGNANSKNKIPIIIPCHRVLSSNSIGGYSGGVDKKIWLLYLEKSNKKP